MWRLVTVTAFTLVAIVVLSSALFAQGPPASVTSMGFGGHGNATPGVPASVTSIGFGRTGSQVHNPFFNQPPCCINPLFPSNPNPQRPGRNHHRFPIGGAYPVYIPYATYGVAEPVDDSMEQTSQPVDEYRGGPTIFDRRGQGTPAPSETRYAERPSHDEQASASPPAPEPAPAADQPETVLVFKDGHQLGVRNYAIIGDTLYDMTDGHRRKVALAELDLQATTKQNDDRGIDFRLPLRPQAN